MGLPKTLLDALEGGDPKSPALLCSGNAQLSRTQLKEQCMIFAEAVRRAGIKTGDAVSIAETNTVEFVIAFIGVTLARGVAAPLNPNYTEDEYTFYMEDASSKLLLVPATGSKHAEAAASRLSIPVASMQLQQQGGTRMVLSPKAQGLRLSTDGLQARLAQPPHDSDVALFLHTSGTTSKPKGVPLTHANLAASLHNIAVTYELTDRDRSLLVMPLFHVHGLMAGLLAPLLAHSAVIIPAGGRFSAKTFWEDACHYRATFYTAVPTMHQILLQRAAQDYPKDSPPPLRFIRSCSSSLAAPTLHKLEAAFKVPVLEAYAMTEASHQMTSNPLPKHGPHKPGTVGRAQGTVKLTILDEKNQELPTGKIGEVCIQGPNVTKGYINRPEANEEAFAGPSVAAAAGGWFHTGDQGFLDEEGYLTLTGRLKELINRGGEKISPLEVDSALLSHPLVTEAVSFGAPDEKYGESVAAAVVLSKPVDDEEATVAEIKKAAASKLAKYKVPEQIFITDKLPKGATGKIQRRNMPAAFLGDKKKKKTGGRAKQPTLDKDSGGAGSNGFSIAAQALAALGISHMYGVIGIPVTELASAAQAAGIRFIGFRNEQAAGYAAAACGFLTGVPGALLTVSGPGAVHGIAGLSHAQINTWPMIMISGSAEQGEIGKGAFQELDQVAAVKPFTKYAGQAKSAAEIPAVLKAAVQAAVSGRPGPSYVDIPSDVLMASSSSSGVPSEESSGSLGSGLRTRAQASDSSIQQAVDLLKQAQRPLVVIGKGAAYSQADAALRQLVDQAQLPFLATAMGRGVVPDTHAACANAARSLALAKADVAIVFGARLNWQLHFGDPPKWSSNVKFILVDVEPSQRDADKAALVVRGDAAAIAQQLSSGLQGLDTGRSAQWRQQLAQKAAAAKHKLEERLAKEAFPLDYNTALRVIRDALLGISPAPVVVSEGANTMDNARVILEPAMEGRLRLDAATWGTMGVGLGYAIAAATTRPERLVVAVEGDSAFGFSGMECETIARYQLPIVVIVFNNGGIYGGDRRQPALQEAARAGAAKGSFSADPVPTAFVANARYEAVMEAFGGDAYAVHSAAELAAACRIAFAARKPALLNVAIDPFAGVESGNVHAFNQPSKL